jgi:hypothetical protein
MPTNRWAFALNPTIHHAHLSYNYCCACTMVVMVAPAVMVVVTTIAVGIATFVHYARAKVDGHYSECCKHH